MDQPLAEVRAARSDELEAMLGLMCEAFGLPYAPARELFYHDPYFDIARKLVLVEGDQIISCLTIVDSPTWIGRAVVPVGGIAGVATRIAYRRRGYARQLLTAALEVLHDQGYGLAALFPYAYGYYRRLGWERAGSQATLRVSPSSLPAYTEARHVRAARPSDRCDIAALYDAWSRGRTGCRLRDARRWDYLLAHVRNAAVYKRTVVEGYALYETQQDADGARLRLLEIVTSTDRSRRALTGFLSAQEVIEVEHPLAPGAVGSAELAVAGSPASDTDWPRVEVLPGPMLRIVDLLRCVQALTPNWEGFRGSLTIALRGNHAPAEARHALTLSGDGLTVCAHPVNEAAPGVAGLEGDARAWAQVVAGYLSLEDAVSLNRIYASSDAAVELAAPLFPRRDLFIPPADHF